MAAQSIPRLAPLAALTPMVWGTTYLVTTEFLPPGHPLFNGAMRALPVGLVVLAITRTLPTGDWWWRATVLGTLNIGLFFGLLFVGAQRLPGGVAATVGAIGPILVMVFARWWMGEQFTRWRLGWAAAAVAGIALLVLRSTAALDGVGMVAAVAAAVLMSAGVVLTRKWGRPVGLFAFTGWQLLSGGLVVAVLALLVEGPPPQVDGRGWLGFAWLGIISTLGAYALWFWALGRLQPVAVSFLGLLSPVTATLLGWFVLDQTLTPLQLAGAALTLVAVLAGQRPGKPADSPSAQESQQAPSQPGSTPSEIAGRGGSVG